MLLNIREMALGRVRFHETFLPGAIDFFDLQLRQAAPIESSGSAELMQSTMEIRVRGHMSTLMEIACDRCLEPTQFPINADFDLLYRPDIYNPEHAEVAIEGAETEVGFYEGDGLELEDVLREEILLLLPMQRICREECKGICPVCGQNRNVVACNCHEEPQDDRWSALKNL